MKKTFKYYLHDSYERSEAAEVLASALGVEEDDEIFEKMGRPFYEVELTCEIDMETGEVTILSAR